MLFDTIFRFSAFFEKYTTTNCSEIYRAKLLYFLFVAPLQLVVVELFRRIDRVCDIFL